MIAGRLSLLCVDDEPEALEHLEGVLKTINSHLSVRFFGSPSQAVAAHRDEPADIVISDLRMGTTTGLKVIAEMQAFAPQTIYMLLSGEADLQSALQAMNEQRVFKFFQKPAAVDELRKGLFEASTELNLRRMRAISGASLEAVDRMGAPVAFIDVKGQLIHANKSAETLFRENEMFDITPDERLSIRNRQDSARFLELLQSLSHDEEAQDEKCVFRFAREDTAIPISASILFCKAEKGASPYYSLVFSDPSRKNVTTAAAIAAALDLTPSEARVVNGLAEGASVEEAAAQAGVSLSTARTYIKNVFSKTGVSRQAELVRLALLAVA